MSDEHQQSAEWFLRFRLGEVDARAGREFDRWLRSSPQCLKAYLEVSALWDAGADSDPLRQWATDTLIQESRAEQNEVLPFIRPSTSADETAPMTARRRNIRRIAVAAAVAVVLILSAAIAFVHFLPTTYETAVGEQRYVTLSDGSRFDLNTDSRVRVRYTRHMRLIELLRGEALFSDVDEARRPFVVEVAGSRVRAIGTEFDIYRGASSTSISVIQGSVEVLPGGPSNARADAAAHMGSAHAAGGRTAIVRSGHSLSLTGTGETRLTTCDTNAVIAWMRGELILNSVSLADAAAQFNRYNTRQLIIDAGLAHIRISGVFFFTDPQSFVLFLQKRLGLKAIAADPDVLILGAGPAGTETAGATPAR